MAQPENTALGSLLQFGKLALAPLTNLVDDSANWMLRNIELPKLDARGSLNWSFIPADRVQRLVKMGLAQENKESGYVFFADRTGSKVTGVILEPASFSQDTLPLREPVCDFVGRNFEAHSAVGSNLEPIRQYDRRALQKAEIGKYDEHYLGFAGWFYRAVSFVQNGAEVSDIDPSVAVSNLRSRSKAILDDYAKRVKNNGLAKQNISVGNTLTFLLHLLPFGGSTDKLLNNKTATSLDIGLSIAGDAAMLASVGLASVTKFAKGAAYIHGAAAAIDLGIAATRFTEAYFAVQDGKTDKAYGYIGEGFLGLLGFSLASINAIRVHQLATAARVEGALSRFRRAGFTVPHGEDVLYLDAVQSRRFGGTLFQEPRIGPVTTERLDPNRYLWTFDQGGINIVLEQTPTTGPRGFMVHTNVSSAASAAGELWFTGPRRITINANSGRFGATASRTGGMSQAEYDAAVEHLRSLGYEVTVTPIPPPRPARN